MISRLNVRGIARRSRLKVAAAAFLSIVSVGAFAVVTASPAQAASCSSTDNQKISAKWRSLGGANWGAAKGGPFRVRGGCVQNFMAGGEPRLITKKDSHSYPHAIRGRMWGYYANKGFEQGFLGWAHEEERPIQRYDGSYAVQEFDGGLLYYHRRNDAVSTVNGQIREVYRGGGYENSCLGMPVSDERNSTTGREQNFDGGRLVWNSKTHMVIRTCDNTYWEGATGRYRGPVPPGTFY